MPRTKIRDSGIRTSGLIDSASDEYTQHTPNAGAKRVFIFPSRV